MSSMFPLIWQQSQAMQSRSYTCGFCGCEVASEKGWDATRQERKSHGYVTVNFGAIYLCHRCCRPTFFDGDTKKQIPGIPFGKNVTDVSDELLRDIYNEARIAVSAGCFTSAVLCCRKLLMHLAVAKGAKPNDTFQNYVNFLSENGHITTECKPWVEEIRKTGNEANHEIKMMKRDDAEDLIKFCEMLLKINFEFPAIASKRKSGLVAVTNKN